VLFPKSTGPGPPVPPDTPRIGATFYAESRLFHEWQIRNGASCRRDAMARHVVPKHWREADLAWWPTSAARVVDGLGHVIHERLFAIELDESDAPQLRDPSLLSDLVPALAARGTKVASAVVSLWVAGRRSGALLLLRRLFKPHNSKIVQPFWASWNR
jgi:hypothetical protein